MTTDTALREALFDINYHIDDPMWANHSEVSKNALKRWSKAIAGDLAQQLGVAAGKLLIVAELSERAKYLYPNVGVIDQRKLRDGYIIGWIDAVQAMSQPDAARDEELVQSALDLFNKYYTYEELRNGDNSQIEAVAAFEIIQKNRLVGKI